MLILATDSNPGDAQWVVGGGDATVEVVNTFGLDSGNPVVAFGPSKATGSATINVAPLSAGDILEIGGVNLTGVAGARTSSSNDFDASLGTVDDIARNIISAINDPNNSFQNNVVAFSGGAGIVNLEAAQGGSAGNDLTLSATTVPGGRITVSGATLTGGNVRANTTITFPAAGTDLLLKKFFAYSAADQAFDTARFLFLTSIRVDGGANLVSGVIPLPVNAATSPISSPNLNIPLPTGSVVEVIVQNLASGVQLVIPTWTTVGLPSPAPVSRALLGGADYVVTGTATAATTAVTVTAAGSVLPGDSLHFEDLMGVATPLTGSSGARVSGQNDFDASLGTISAIVADIVAAINDTGNDFDPTFTAVDNDPIVTITGGAGEAANTAFFIDVTSAGMTPATAAFTGGANVSHAFVFAAAPADAILERVYFEAILPAEGAEASDIIIISSITIDGGPNLIEGQFTSALVSATGRGEGPLFDFPISAGEVVTVTIESTATVGLAAAWITRAT